jgi:hypothetical protein
MIDISIYIIKFIVDYPYKFIDKSIQVQQMLLYSVVAELLYLCKCARPDIMTSMKRVQDANEDNKNINKKVRNYSRICKLYTRR